MPLVRVVNSAEDIRRVHDRAHAPDLVGADQLGVEADDPVARPVCLEIVPTLWRRRQVQAAGEANADVLARDLLDLLVD